MFPQPDVLASEAASTVLCWSSTGSGRCGICGAVAWNWTIWNHSYAAMVENSVQKNAENLSTIESRFVCIQYPLGHTQNLPWMPCLMRVNGAVTGCTLDFLTNVSNTIINHPPVITMLYGIVLPTLMLLRTPGYHGRGSPFFYILRHIPETLLNMAGKCQKNPTHAETFRTLCLEKSTMMKITHIYGSCSH